MSSKYTLRAQAGFTLIEIMLVLAISSSLAAVAFMGQRALRSQAQFDAAIEKVVSSVSSAQTQSAAGVNTLGAGDGTNPCDIPSYNPGDVVVFSGSSWRVYAGFGVGVDIQIELYKSILAGAKKQTCTFAIQKLSVPIDLQLVVPPSKSVQSILFVRTDTGAQSVCYFERPNLPSYTNLVRNSFLDASCQSGASTFSSVILSFTDADGHKSDIQIDGSGLAKRLN